MHWRTATKICMAVFRFAETGQGRLEWVAPRRMRLREQGAMADIIFDERNGTLNVLHIFATK